MCCSPIVLAALWLLQGSAPETMLLVAEKYQVAAGAAVVLHTEQLDAGLAAKRIAWPGSMEGFFTRHAGQQENRDAMPADAGTSDQLTLVFESADVAMIGINLTARDLTLTAAELRALLPSSSPLQDKIGASAPVHELRSCKTLVRVGAAAPSATSTSKTTQASEIRPLMDPTALKVPSDLPFRLLERGRAAASAKVIVLHRESGTREDLVTDSIG